MSNKLIIFGLTLVVLGFIPLASAGDCTSAEACKESAKGWIAVGAGIAVGLAGLGTGIAQSQIGAAAVGATAEDAGFLGRSLIYVAIPETIVIFGLLIAFQLVGKIA